MSKTVLIKYHPNVAEREFTVGSFVHIDEHHFRSKKLIPAQLVYWINQMALKGLIFHSEYQGTFIFRVEDVNHDRT